MGCGGSRFDKRNKASQDLNTVGLQFVGGEDHETDGCPVDKFVCSKGELAAQFPTAEHKATDEAGVKKIFLATQKAVADLLKEHNDQKAKDAKDPLVGNKYKLSDAIKQLTDVLAGFEKADIKEEGAAPPKEEEKNDPPKDPPKDETGENEGGECEYEGGDDPPDDPPADPPKDDPPKDDPPADPKKDAMEVVSPHKYDGDEYDYAGWANVPALFLKQATQNAYWGDLIKSSIVNWEFNDAKAAKDDKWLGAAGLIVGGLATSGRADGDGFFSGRLGTEDLESLKGMADNKPILFPGWIAGWATQEEADGHIKTLNEKPKDTHNVSFKVAGGSLLKFAACRVMGVRLQGTVTKYTAAKDDAGTHYFEVTGKPFNAQTIEEWKKAAADGAKGAVVPPADPPKDDPPKDDPPKDDPPKDDPPKDD